MFPICIYFVYQTKINVIQQHSVLLKYLDNGQDNVEEDMPEENVDETAVSESTFDLTLPATHSVSLQ